MSCPDKYDLLVTYDGVSHGLLCDWTQKGVGLQIDPPQVPQSTQVSTKGSYGVRDANDFFRIVQTDWSEGCGQTTYDREEDSENAFLESQFVDISTKGNLKLGPKSSFVSGGGAASSVSCAGLVDGSGNPLVWSGSLATPYLSFSKDGVTWAHPAAHTFDNPGPPTSLCTDGTYVYGCFGGVVSKSTIADTLPFSTNGSNATMTYVAFASGTLYGVRANQLGSFSQVAQPVWTALSPVLGSAINTDGGTTFGLVSSGNYVYWGMTNGMVTKVYKALNAGGAAKDELTAVATFPAGFVGSSLHAYLGTIYVGGHFDAETAGCGIGAIYAIINDSPSLLTNVGTDRTQKWGIISISSYERSLYFLTGNGHVYRWDLVNGGYSHVMDVSVGLGALLGTPATWTKAWTMAAAPASPASISNTSTDVSYGGTLTTSQNAATDSFTITEAVGFNDTTGETLEVDVPAYWLASSRGDVPSGKFTMGIFGSAKDIRVRFWRGMGTGTYQIYGDLRSGADTLLTTFTAGADIASAHTFRLTLEGTAARLSCDGVLIATGTASADVGATTGVWIQAQGPEHGSTATKVSEVRWSTAGIFGSSIMPVLSGGSSIVCARDKVFSLCQDATLGGCQVTSTTEYSLSGSLTSSKSSGSMPTVDKFFNRLDVQLENLPTGCGLTAVVTIDGSSIGPIAGTLTGPLMTFPIGVVGRSISYSLNLTTEDSLQTPVVSEVAVLFTPAPNTAKVYTYMVKCWDKGEDNNDGDWDEKAGVVADFLEEIANNIVTVERPGSAAYTGKVEGVQFLEAPPSRKANGREGLYQVSVRNVGTTYSYPDSRVWGEPIVGPTGPPGAPGAPGVPGDPGVPQEFPSYFVGADTPGAPEAVQAPEGFAGITQITLKWTLPSEALWRHWQVFEGTVSGFVPGTPIFTTDQNVVSIPHAAGSGPWYYKVRAVNSRGEASADTQFGPFTLPRVATDDMVDDAITAIKMAPGSVNLGSNAIVGNLGVANLVAADALIGHLNTGTALIGSAVIGVLTADKLATADAIIARLNAGTASIAAARIANLDAGQIVTGVLNANVAITGNVVRTGSGSNRVVMSPAQVGSAVHAVSFFYSDTLVGQLCAIPEGLSVTGPGLQVIVASDLLALSQLKVQGPILPYDFASDNSNDGIWVQDRYTASSRWKVSYNSSTGKLYLSNGTGAHWVQMS